jgi:transcriptional regulator with XRE-family HTH domain
MAHALADFIRQQMDERRLRNADVEKLSGLSRQLVSTYAKDKREKLTRLPERSTVEGFARAFGVSPDFLLGKAIEALDLGYTSGDFVNSVSTATDRELLDQIERRLLERGKEHDRPAANTGAADRGARGRPPRSGGPENAEERRFRKDLEDRHDVEKEPGQLA